MIVILNTFYVGLIILTVGNWLHCNITVWRLIIALIVSNSVIFIAPLSGLVLFISFVSSLLIAFPKHLIIRAAVMSIGAACLIGGMLLVVHDYWPKQIFGQTFMFVTLTLILFGMFSKRIKGWKSYLAQRQYVTNVALKICNEIVVLKGFIDSGNSCMEPISGHPIHFVKLSALKHEQLQPLIHYITLLQQELNANGLRNLPIKNDIRVAPTNSIHQQNTLSICVKGTVFLNEKEQASYFIFVGGKDYFPHRTSVLLNIAVI